MFKSLTLRIIISNDSGRTPTCPPRKKATATDASDAAKPASTRATRSSTRAKAPSSKASTSAAAAVVPAPASKAKTKAKRGRAASDEEDEDEEDEELVEPDEPGEEEAIRLVLVKDVGEDAELEDDAVLVLLAVAEDVDAAEFVDVARDVWVGADDEGVAEADAESDMGGDGGREEERRGGQAHGVGYSTRRPGERRGVIWARILKSLHSGSATAPAAYHILA
ncbi:hypothetical protein EVJ58_g2980 [Rhodofomes roseus]|uniref:Uncharacterized protein n=1 Tax=Rhodofomes roseus TaxID=34475 RepID=A0A4Y9YN00_9APHY|nr:hypothetical protein EVJ58_g2980 [Rhodofomes roseus]